MVAPETSSRRELSAFKLTAWTADPESIPSLRWLAIPKPGLVVPLMEPPLLQYKVLIHLDSVSDYSGCDEPLFLGVSSDSGQSGVPSDGRISGGVANAAVPQRMPWRFGVRDVRGTGVGTCTRGSAASPVQLAGADWRLPPMASREEVTADGPLVPVRDRLSIRVLAFDRLTVQAGPGAPERISNSPQRPASNVVVERQPTSTACPMTHGAEMTGATSLAAEREGEPIRDPNMAATELETVPERSLDAQMIVLRRAPANRDYAPLLAGATEAVSADVGIQTDRAQHLPDTEGGSNGAATHVEVPAQPGADGPAAYSPSLEPIRMEHSDHRAGKNDKDAQSPSRTVAVETDWPDNDKVRQPLNSERGPPIIMPRQMGRVDENHAATRLAPGWDACNVDLATPAASRDLMQPPWRKHCGTTCWVRGGHDK